MLFLLLYLFQMKQIPKLFLFQQQQLIQQLSKKIVDTTVNVFTNEVKETLNINNITTVDDAKLQTSPVSPSVPKNIVIGGLVGAILSIGIIFIRFMLDNRLHTKEDVEKYLEIPNLGVIPYFED